MTKKIALYPGTFDPFTYGHLDIIKRAIKIVDTLYVGIAHNKNKKTLFNIKLVNENNNNDYPSKKRTSEPRRIITKKIGRNETCPCGAGKKYKHCHGS